MHYTTPYSERASSPEDSEYMVLVMNYAFEFEVRGKSHCNNAVRKCEKDKSLLPCPGVEPRVSRLLVKCANHYTSEAN